jgi:hypothetical protein
VHLARIQVERGVELEPGTIAFRAVGIGGDAGPGAGVTDILVGQEAPVPAERRIDLVPNRAHDRSVEFRGRIALDESGERGLLGRVGEQRIYLPEHFLDVGARRRVPLAKPLPQIGDVLVDEVGNRLPPLECLSPGIRRAEALEAGEARKIDLPAEQLTDVP